MQNSRLINNDKSNPSSRCVPFSSLPKQSIPSVGLPSLTCLDLTSARVSIGDRPLFSASARGIESSAEANARIAYCSIDGICKSEYDKSTVEQRDIAL